VAWGVFQISRMREGGISDVLILIRQGISFSI
jgi:hypothetical protein